jgi:hypothetical protein
VKRLPPDFSMSLLDMFITCIGCMAFLLVLFAAMHKEPEPPEARPAANYLFIDFDRPNGGPLMQVGRDIGLAVVDGDKKTVYQGEQLLAPYGFWPPATGSKYSLQLKPAPGQAFFLAVWLRNLDVDKLGMDRYQQLLKNGLRFDVYWATKPYEKLREGGADNVLHRGNLFFQVVALTPDAAGRFPWPGRVGPQLRKVADPFPGAGKARPGILMPGQQLKTVHMEWDPETGWGRVILETSPPLHWRDLRFEGRSITERPADELDTIDRFFAAIRQATHPDPVHERVRYVAVGDRGVAAVLYTSGRPERVAFGPLGRWKAGVPLLGIPAAENNMYDIPLALPFRDHEESGSTVEQESLARAYADALALGFVGMGTRFPLRQDPLFQLFRPSQKR